MAQKREFDPMEMVERAISNNLDAGVFSKLDERSIKRAANWLEWCIGEEFLAMKPGPFPRQIQMALKFFGEYCPRCSTKGYVEDLFKQSMADIRANITLLEFGVCPKCNVTQTDMFLSGELGEYNELDCCWGRRSGKTVFASMVASYHLHRYLMIKDASRYFGTLQNQTLHMLFVAITKGQAEDTVWQAFRDRIDSAPWFKTYHAFLDEYSKKNGLKPLYDFKETFIWYEHKRLMAQVVTTNVKTSRGRTTIMTTADELSWLDAGSTTEGVLTNAEETHNSLAQSNRTVRSGAMMMRHEERINNVPTAIDINISSPASANDMLMRLIRSSSVNKEVCASHLPTWQVNPRISYESLDNERRANYKAFMRDYGAVPPMADSAFMDDEPSVLRAAKKDLRNMLGWSVARDRDDTGVDTLWLECQPRVRDKMTPRILCIDPGESNNSFALVLASLDAAQQTVRLDGIIECQPEKRDNGEVIKVNFPRMFDRCVVPIIGAFNIRLVVSDHWQSSDLLQRLRSDFKVKSDTYSLRYPDMISIRTSWYDGRVVMPAPERDFEDFKRTTEQLEDFYRGLPVLKLLVQAMTVREVGHRIIKPQHGSDDIFRATCLAVRFLLDPEQQQPFIYSGAGQRSKADGRIVGVVRSNRQVGGSVTQYGSHIGSRKARLDPTGLVGGLQPRRSPS